jgi:LeuA allosteric (dimerisation) domain
MSPSPRTASDRHAEEAPTLHLARWTVTSGSNVNSRGAVVIAAGDHQWEAATEGNGAVDALFRAIDRALADVLTGQPRLLAYDVHAVAEGPAAEGKVTVSIAPPSGAATDDAGNRKRARVGANDAKARRAELDEEAGRIDTTEWFNQ